MWLTLEELASLGVNPSHYQRTSKIMKVMVAEVENNPDVFVFSDLKTGNPVLYFENCEVDRRTLVEICCNLKEVDQQMTIGIISVARLLEIMAVALDGAPERRV